MVALAKPLLESDAEPLGERLVAVEREPLGEKDGDRVCGGEREGEVETEAVGDQEFVTLLSNDFHEDAEADVDGESRTLREAIDEGVTRPTLGDCAALVDAM